MIDETWAFTPALDQAKAVASGKVKASELVELYYDRIARFNPGLDAYVLLTQELASEQVSGTERRLTQDASLGPLDGVPLSIKESASLAGYPLTNSSRAFENNIARVDSFAVSRLKSAGAVILGKTNAPEFGTRPVTEGPLYPPARNPWDLERTAGGSSGGAAAAVAAGLCALAHGADGGGSVRIPAACCGVVGLKPSRGRISSGPLLGESWAGLATHGVIARTVSDAAVGLDAMAGHLPGDPYWADTLRPFLPATMQAPRRLRVGWTASCRAPVDSEIAGAVGRLAGSLEENHDVREVAVDLTRFSDIIQLLAVTSVGTLPIKERSVLDPINRAMWDDAPNHSAAEYLGAITRLQAAARQLVALWDEIDVLVTPTLTTLPPRIGDFGQDVETAGEEFRDWLAFLYPFNCTGQPAISLPLARSAGGLPIGIQLVGAPRDEHTILSLAAQLESSASALGPPPMAAIVPGQPISR
jgi:amidase